jgi:hypothetical protein
MHGAVTSKPTQTFLGSAKKAEPQPYNLQPIKGYRITE